MGQSGKYLRCRVLGHSVFPIRVVSFILYVRLRACVTGKILMLYLQHGFGTHLLIAAGARFAGVRRILSLVGTAPPPEPALLRRIAWRAHLARPLVTCEIACSQYVKDRMVREYRLPAKRIRVIHNGVRAEEIARRAGAARSARKHAATSDLVILMDGGASGPNERSCHGDTRPSLIKTCLSRIAPETGWRWPYAPGTGSARGRGYTAFLRCVNRQATCSLGTIAC